MCPVARPWGGLSQRRDEVGVCLVEEAEIARFQAEVTALDRENFEMF